MQDAKQKSKRLFIACRVPDHDNDGVSINLAAVQKELCQLITSFKPSKTPHVTLLFIGQVPVEVKKDSVIQETEMIIKDAVENALSNFNRVRDSKPIIVSITGLTLLGRHKQVVAFTLHENKALHSLWMAVKQEINERLHEYGLANSFKNEKNFLAHITMGRIDKKDQLLTELLIKQSQFFDPERQFILNTLTLFESTPTAYIPLWTWSLIND